MLSKRHIFPLITLLTGVFALPAYALDSACEQFLAAAEKTVQQPARQSVMDLGGGQRMEAIVDDDVLYAKIEGKWRKIKSGFWADERALLADMRKGTIKLEQCKQLGSEIVDGIATTIVGYTMTMPGTDAVSNKVYIGKDGLLYAQSGPNTKVRYRYQGVTAPKL